MSTNCKNCDKNFEIFEEDMQFYGKIHVPAPTWCPQCRLIRRMTWRNERSLYRRSCDLCKRSIISAYAADAVSPVYCEECWWSYKWDPMAYGKKYDFTKNFFSQFKELQDAVPAVSLFNINASNSDYCNYMAGARNSYLIFGGKENENVLYSNRTYFCRDSMDIYTGTKLELCYETIQCSNSYNLSFSKYCDSCNDSAFLYDCKSCQNCFGCTSLRGKQYYIFNQPHTKEDYFATLKAFDLGSFSTVRELKKRFREIYGGAVHRYAQILKSQNTTGDNVQNCRNCKECFDLAGTGYQDSKFCHYTGVGIKDSYDVYGLSQGESLYECIALGFESNENANYFFSQFVKGSNQIHYSYNCSSSNFLFGCVGLRGKSYCIFNMQYTKEEYDALVPKIIEQMKRMPYIDKGGRVYAYGEFFPIELSPFAYNETIAQEHFPLTREEIEARGYIWREPETKNYAPTLMASAVPDNIKETDDSITDKIISCEHAGLPHGCNEQCTTAFKITPQELQFYKRMNFSVPHLCPNCRHYARIKERNSFTLWKRRCRCAGMKSDNGVYTNSGMHAHGTGHCPSEFETPYPPESPEIVYCESCYQAEVV